MIGIRALAAALLTIGGSARLGQQDIAAPAAEPAAIRAPGRAPRDRRPGPAMHAGSKLARKAAEGKL